MIVDTNPLAEDLIADHPLLRDDAMRDRRRALGRWRDAWLWFALAAVVAYLCPVLDETGFDYFFWELFVESALWPIGLMALAPTLALIGVSLVARRHYGPTRGALVTAFGGGALVLGAGAWIWRIADIEAYVLGELLPAWVLAASPVAIALGSALLLAGTAIRRWYRDIGLLTPLALIGGVAAIAGLCLPVIMVATHQDITFSGEGVTSVENIDPIALITVCLIAFAGLIDLLALVLGIAALFQPAAVLPRLATRVLLSAGIVNLVALTTSTAMILTDYSPLETRVVANLTWTMLRLGFLAHIAIAVTGLGLADLVANRRFDDDALIHHLLDEDDEAADFDDDTVATVEA